MAVYSVNQATQFYVVAAAPTVKKTDDGKVKIVGLGANKDLATDLINKKKVISITKKEATTLVPTVKAKKITISEANPGAYIMRVIINNYFAEGATGAYIKHASAYIAAGEDATKLAKKLADSLENGLKRDLEPAFKVEAEGAVITITPLATEWVLGRKATTIPEIVVELVPTDPMEMEASWAGVTEETVADSAVAPNRDLAYEILADYEYFCLGERGDIYRGAGWPNNIETKGEIEKGVAYDIVTVHYYEDLTNESVQKSEKTAVFACANNTAAAVEAAFTHPITDLNARVEELEKA